MDSLGAFFNSKRLLTSNRANLREKNANNGWNGRATGMGVILYPKESYAINGAAMEVYNSLGPGFLEAVYQEAMAIEFLARGIPFELQKELTIRYKGNVLAKKYIADLFAHGKIVVELKSQKAVTDVDKAQTINYLKATDCSLGIIFNFGCAEKLEMHRLVRTPKT
jgi:GxxExxY protein